MRGLCGSNRAPRPVTSQRESSLGPGRRVGRAFALTAHPRSTNSEPPRQQSTPHTAWTHVGDCTYSTHRTVG